MGVWNLTLWINDNVDRCHVRGAVSNKDFDG